MDHKIRIGIYGYGNLGRGAELAIRQNPDMELVAFFTRREPSALKTLTPGVPVCKAEDVLNWRDKIDVMILCGGSAKDLPVQSPELSKHFNILDSFDNHGNIPQHFAACDAAAFTQKKIKATGFAAMDPTPPKYYHTRLDTPDLLVPEALEVGVKVLLETACLYDSEGLI